MKQTLLLLSVIFCSTFLMAQGSDSFQERYLLFPDRAQEVSTNIQLYPNPAIDYFQLTKYEGVKKVTVINMLGKTLRVFEKIAEDKKFRVADLPRGMYLVQITDTNNKVVATKRIKKQ